MRKPDDKIELTLPLNEAYITAAQLTASSIAARLEFSMDAIEDIKAAVSEACLLIIRKAETKRRTFKIKYIVQENTIEIVIAAKFNIAANPNEELGVLKIKAMTDFFELTQEDGAGFELVMRKKHGRKDLD